MNLINSSNDADLKLPNKYSFGLFFPVVFASEGAYVLHKSSPSHLEEAFFVAAAIVHTIDLLMGGADPHRG